MNDFKIIFFSLTLLTSNVFIAQLTSDKWYQLYNSEEISVDISFSISKNGCSDNALSTIYKYRYNGKLSDNLKFINWSIDYINCKGLKYTYSSGAKIGGYKIQNELGKGILEELIKEDFDDAITTKKIISNLYEFSKSYTKSFSNKIKTSKSDKVSVNTANNYHLEFVQKTNSYIYLFKIQGSNPSKIDSSKSLDEVHIFNIELTKSDIYLVGSAPDKSVLFIASPDESNKFVFKNEDYSELDVSGDSTNILLQEYFKYRNGIISQIQNINSSSQESKTIAQNLIITKYQEYIRNFISENRNSPSILMMLGEIQNPMEFKRELGYIKNVIIEKYENQTYVNEVNKLLERINQQESFLIQQQNRAENPNVVRLYNQYKEKGFTVYSVSLDQKKDKWLEAISKDQLSWPNHVSELSGWNSTAGTKYGITSIPKTFLINKNGKIVAYNLKGAALEKKLAEIL